MPKARLPGWTACTLALILVHASGAELPETLTDNEIRATGLSQQSFDEGRFLGRAVPDATLALDGGRIVTLSAVTRGKPFLLALNYTRCTGVCSPFLFTLRNAVNEVGGLGAGYRVVVLSFDPHDTPIGMARLAGSLGLGDDPGWTFATAPPETVARIADAIGFWHRWDDRRQQFDHPALLAAVRDGRIVRLLNSGAIDPGRLRDVVTEMCGRFVPTYPQSGAISFRCFDYDPVRGFTPDWGMVLLVLPAVAALTATALVFAAADRGR